MNSQLSGRLRTARRFQFVGREMERAMLDAALAQAELPFYVVYIFGPGGVGKTTLLREFIHICQQRQTPVIYIDGRNVEASPESFLDAQRRAMNVTEETSLFEAIATHPGYEVILIDTYELLAPLDDWLREVFLPQLPDNALIVLAGRRAPSAAWRADPGWQTLIRVLPLRNLSPNESQVYLEQRSIPADQHETVLNFTHGHPLALSLVAELFAQRRDIRFQPEEAPDIVKTLLEQFVQKVPGPAHRAALEICALVRLTNESLLADILQMPDVHELFEWLRDLSFIESGRNGLFPHDLAREALVADLKWRNPEWYVELHRRARTYYTSRLAQVSGRDQQRLLLDLIFLHRDSAMVRPFFEWQEGSVLLTDALDQSDIQTVQAMVKEHEGEESARLASYWIARQAEGMLVFRDSKGQVVGFLGMVALHQTTAEDREADPALRSTWNYLNNHAPLRPGESGTLFRFWMAKDTYQAVSPIQSLIFVTVVRHYLTTPGVAFTFFPCADPEFWEPIFAYGELARLPQTDFTVGGRRYGVYGHDWRVMPPVAWLNMLAEREIAMEGTTPTAPPVAEPVIVLSESEFASAVLDALRDFTRPDLLRGSPLLRSRLILDRVGMNSGENERVAGLRDQLQEAADGLQRSPREAKLYRALYHTYFQPAPTQERAAEVLDLPFSTFRRHLKAGITQVTDMLWQREIGGLEK
jgi:hypothetical protein